MANRMAPRRARRSAVRRLLDGAVAGAPTRTRLRLAAIVGGNIVGILYEASLELQPSIAVAADDLGVSVALVGLAVAASLAAHLAGTRMLVPLGDHFSRRGLATGMCALAGLALAAMSTCQQIACLTVTAGITGALATGTYVAQALVLSSMPLRTGSLNGLFTCSWALGIVEGKVLSVQLAEAGAWRLGPAWQALALIALAGPLWLVLPRESRPPTPALMLALDDLKLLSVPRPGQPKSGRAVPRPRWRHWALLQVMAALRVSLAARYRHVSEGSAWGAEHLPFRRLLGDRRLRALCLASAGVAATLTPFDTYLAAEVERQGFSLTWLSVLTITIVLGALVAWRAGRTVERHPRAAVLPAGLALLAAWGVMFVTTAALGRRPAWLAGTFLAETLLEIGTTVGTMAFPALALLGRREHTSRITGLAQQFRLLGGLAGTVVGALGELLAGWHGVQIVGLALSVLAVVSIVDLLHEFGPPPGAKSPGESPPPGRTRTERLHGRRPGGRRRRRGSGGSPPSG